MKQIKDNFIKLSKYQKSIQAVRTLHVVKYFTILCSLHSCLLQTQLATAAEGAFLANKLYPSGFYNAIM